MQCAELQAYLTPLETAREAAALSREYAGALLAVERNNHGAGVLAHLAGVCRYEPLYRRDGLEGFLTTSITRSDMLAHLDRVLVESPSIFSSDRLLRECRSFVRKGNGRLEARGGEHDDCVMAMAIAQMVRREQPVSGRVH